MNKNAMKKNLGVMLSFLLVTLAVQAQPLWVWREGGTTVHSDQPPPPNIPASQILKSPGGMPVNAPAATNQAPESTGATPATSSSTNKNKSAAELEAEFKERQNKKAEQDKKTAEEAQKKQQSAQECERSRGYLRALQEGIRIRSTADNSVLDDAGRQKEVARIQEQLKNCK